MQKAASEGVSGWPATLGAAALMWSSFQWSIYSVEQNSEIEGADRLGRQFIMLLLPAAVAAGLFAAQAGFMDGKEATGFVRNASAAFSPRDHVAPTAAENFVQTYLAPFPPVLAMAVARNAALKWLIALGVMANAFHFICNCFVGVTRILMSMDLDRMLPGRLSLTRGEDTTPSPLRAHLTYLVASLPVSALYCLWDDSQNPLGVMLTTTCSYVIIVTSLAAVRVEAAGLRNFWLLSSAYWVPAPVIRTCGVLGVLASLVLLAAYLCTMVDTPDLPYVGACFAIVIAFAFALYRCTRRLLPETVDGLRNVPPEVEDFSLHPSSSAAPARPGPDREQAAVRSAPPLRTPAPSRPMEPTADTSIPGTWIEEVFNRSPLGILQLDAAWGVSYANRVASEICGVADWRAVRFADLFQGEAAREVLAQQRTAREQGQSGEYEVTFTRLDTHAPVRVSVTGTPVLTAAGGFAGSVVVLRSLELENIGRELDELSAQAKSSAQVLAIVADKLRAVIGFDAFAAAAFSQEVTHALVLREEPADFLPGRRRWYPISAPNREIFRAARPARVRLADVFEITGSDVLRQMIADGFQWMLRCPVLSEGRPAGIIALFTKKPEGFTDAEFDLFSRLPLPKVFITGLLLRSREQLEFRHTLVKEIAACGTDQAIFDLFAQRLRDHYDWSHVSVFTVDAIQNLIVLQSQAGNAPLPAGHNQSTADGILGRVARTGRDENVGDVHGPDYARVVYFAEHRPDLTSELCMGIWSRDRVHALLEAEDPPRDALSGHTPRDGIAALLNVEDSHRDAFSSDEEKTLRELLDEVGTIIARRRQDNLARAVIRATPTAVFQVDKDGLIRYANPAAGLLLDCPAEELKGSSIADWVANRDAGDALAQATKPGGRLLIKTREGKQMTVQVGGAVLDETASHRLIVLRDLSYSDGWELRGRAATMLADLARLANTPLSLLSLGLREIRRQAADEQGGWFHRVLAPSPGHGRSVMEVVDRCTAQLRRVELAYGEVQLYGTGNSSVRYREAEIPLPTFLREVLDELPLAQRGRLHASLPEELPRNIRGDVFQLAFVIQTIVAQFFLLGTSADEVVFDAASRDGKVFFGFSRVSPFTDDELQSSASLEIARARAGLSLAEEIIRRFVANHDGTFDAPDIIAGRLTVGFSIPARTDAARSHA